MSNTKVMKKPKTPVAHPVPPKIEEGSILRSTAVAVIQSGEQVVFVPRKGIRDVVYGTPYEVRIDSEDVLLYEDDDCEDIIITPDLLDTNNSRYGALYTAEAYDRKLNENNPIRKNLYDLDTDTLLKRIKEAQATVDEGKALLRRRVKGII